MSAADLRRWARVPILMYHRVAENEVAAGQYFFSISQQRFENQMRCLRRLGYQAVSLDDVLDWLGGRRPFPRRSVAITFDDGYADTYHVAAPILERYGFRATVFLVGDRVGHETYWGPNEEGNGLPLMGWPEARDLARRGFPIGSHTLSHAVLPGLDNARLHSELVGSRELLERRLGQSVHLFAYPRNRTDARSQAAVRAAGYRGACAGDGRGYHPWCLDRVDVSHASLPVFLMKISPWFYAVRRMRRYVSSARLFHHVPVGTAGHPLGRVRSKE